MNSREEGKDLPFRSLPVQLPTGTKRDFVPLGNAPLSGLTGGFCRHAGTPAFALKEGEASRMRSHSS